MRQASRRRNIVMPIDNEHDHVGDQDQEAVQAPKSWRHAVVEVMAWPSSAGRNRGCRSASSVGRRDEDQGHDKQQRDEDADGRDAVTKDQSEREGEGREQCQIQPARMTARRWCRSRATPWARRRRRWPGPSRTRQSATNLARPPTRCEQHDELAEHRARRGWARR